MATFKVDSIKLLAVINAGKAKVQVEIPQKRLQALEMVVSKWRIGFTKDNAKKQYDWEGDVSLDVLESNRGNLPDGFETELSLKEFNYCQDLRSDLAILRKHELICHFAIDDIEFDDIEFAALMSAARKTID